ncbi:MAG: glycosyltransferase family 2 protein [Chloroflexi bacterium]|nr:glycosyltransferase family 2 protein [Chloroflexota bacterium]
MDGVIKSIHQALDGRIPKYEIIIVNDDSRDNTGQVAENLARQNSHLKVIHNVENRGCGFTFMSGVKAAKHEYVWLIPGDDEITTDSIETIANHIGKADMIIPYVLNFAIRPLSRRIVSWGYTALLNVLFWKKLHYYNGPCVIRTDLVKPMTTVNSRGFAFMAPILLRLMKQKHTYTEVGITLQNRRYGKASVNNLLNILSAIKMIAWLVWTMHLASVFKNTANQATAKH